MFKKLVLILIGLIFVVVGAFLFWRGNAKTKQIPATNLLQKPLATAVPTPTPIVANFYETGTVLNWDEANEATSSTWIFLYEAATGATESAKLVFDQNNFIPLENGDQVKLAAFKQDQVITVISLEKIISEL